MQPREYQFDGLVGPTHHYAGLSAGNLASLGHAGEPSNPRAAALEGLAKMARVRGLGVAQAVLPPQPRPDFASLRALGFSGDDATVARLALARAPELLHSTSSASSMWSANAATVVGSADTEDARVHLVGANLVSLLHRSLEAPFTHRVLSRIFGSERHFHVSRALPACDALADEGAANHLRLATEAATTHLFAWGRSTAARPSRFPARQTRAASESVARLCRLPAENTLFVRQDPLGIDGGAFHSDVLAVSQGPVLLLHERAFSDVDVLIAELQRRHGAALSIVLASETELPLADAVAAYPFNSQLLPLPSGKLQLLAPREAFENPAARRFLERVVAEDNPVVGVDYLDVNGSMRNGGGPACLRLRVPLEQAEAAALGGRALFDERLEAELCGIIERRYRDRLVLADLADPELFRDCQSALDEITTALGLSGVFN